jgi:2-succinyl-5-enolpyruvyl-6-hydroxy-3-cyclohexene-1-carboxylate synthase
VAARRAGAELTIVCLDNGGGSIFDFLPVAEAADPELYERHIATPAGVDFERVAAMADIPFTQDPTAPGLILVRSDRTSNVRLHREVVERVSAALG